jgi:hypothetical protein
VTPEGAVMEILKYIRRKLYLKLGTELKDRSDHGKLPRKPGRGVCPWLNGFSFV